MDPDFSEDVNDRVAEVSLFPGVSTHFSEDVSGRVCPMHGLGQATGE